MNKYVPKEQIPIAVVYKKKTGSRHWLKVFTDLVTPDKIISTRSKKLPEGAEIIEIGVGSMFEAKYKKKYRI